MLAAYAKMSESNRDWNDNPGYWIAEGLDKSGIFQLAFEVNNTWEKLGGSGIYVGAAAAFPDRTQRAPASRYANRDAFGSLLGPSFQLGTDVAQLLGIGARATHGDIDLNEADINRAFKMAPFLTLPYFRWAIEGGGFAGTDIKLGEAGLKPQLKEAVSD
ncbi:hypothetical protein AJ88_03910 [Mesorhizobium amorphae CCBAU 01583]|nr:hypothetical protein AJ88_03910 [Mesorhizobium amorphae CCBAU 01583]